MPGSSRPAPLATPAPWHRVLTGPDRARVEERLPAFLVGQRWFGSKARPITAASIRDAIPLGAREDSPWLAIVDVRFAEGPGETYVLPLGWIDAAAAGTGAVIARLHVDGRAGELRSHEGLPGLARGLLADMSTGRDRRGWAGVLEGQSTGAFDADGIDALEPVPLGAEQSNTSIRFGDRFILKLFRKTTPGVNPDLEVGQFLTDAVGFPGTPPALGGVEYRPDGQAPLAVAFLQGFVPNRGDAWRLARAAVSDQLARLASAPDREGAGVGDFPDASALLGRRTAELHRALASRPDLPAFAPEPFTLAAQAALHGEVSRLAATSFALLERRLADLPPGIRTVAAEVLALRDRVPGRTAWLLERPVVASRIRTHGDFHLGQVLWTGSDFVIIDFEGEPARPLAERREKGSALRDVAGMLRSFHYAAHSAPGGDPEAAAALREWYQAVSGAFLASYRAAAGGAPFLPGDEGIFGALLAVHLLEKALYELGYELNNRPDWVGIPLEGLAHLLRGP